MQFCSNGLARRTLWNVPTESHTICSICRAAELGASYLHASSDVPLWVCCVKKPRSSKILIHANLCCSNATWQLFCCVHVAIFMHYALLFFYAGSVTIVSLKIKHIWVAASLLVKCTNMCGLCKMFFVLFLRCKHRSSLQSSVSSRTPHPVWHPNFTSSVTASAAQGDVKIMMPVACSYFVHQVPVGNWKCPNHSDICLKVETNWKPELVFVAQRLPWNIQGIGCNPGLNVDNVRDIYWHVYLLVFCPYAVSSVPPSHDVCERTQWNRGFHCAT